MRVARFVTMALLLTLAGCGGPDVARERRAAEQPAAERLRVPLATSTPKPASEPKQRPNIVLVLMDDFSMDLLPTMRSAAAMQRAGASYRHSFVIDSLCCVSRASLLTGQYPHQTGVRTNQADAIDGVHPMGGYAAFSAYGNEERSFAIRLQEARYTTGFVGKFLNEYTYLPGGPAPPLPPGWDEFNVLFATAYDGWGFHSSYVEDGQLRVREHPTPPVDASVEVKDRSYAGSVISRQALGFIDRHRSDSRPWFLEVAPYAPHNRAAKVGAWPGEPEYPAMFRDRPRPGHPGGNCGPVPCGALGVEDLPGRGDGRGDNAVVRQDGSTVEPWVGGPVQVTKSKAEMILRDRARMVQSVDRLVTRILREVPRNTYVVLTSDNGMHVGQHGLGIGKGAAYDSDIRVPLLVVGPGVRPGERRQVVSNIDLAPTFEDLAGLRPAPQRSGASLVPTFSRPDVEGQNYAFVEHTWSDLAGDPDRPAYVEDKIPSYVAVRSRSSLLVRYDLDPDPEVDRHAWEFYDYDQAGFERTNEYAAPQHRTEVARLTRRIEWLDRCSGVRRDDPVPVRCRDLRR
jgi:N-acetylglucosamine-6-sulfatase